METKKVEMSVEEQQEFEAFKAQKEAKERKAKIKENREAYKALVDETINGVFPSLREVSAAMQTKKTEVYEAFERAIALKAEIYDVPDEQRSNMFTNLRGDKRIVLGQYTTDNYDDTVNEGIAKVKKYIGSLAKDSESKMLVDAILKLLSRDQKGNLKASRVIQLLKMSQESGNEDFIDGVKIIQDAYRPQVSKFYVKAEFKNETGAWVNVPLGMTEA
jgi:hypothetical protein